MLATERGLPPLASGHRAWPGGSLCPPFRVLAPPCGRQTCLAHSHALSRAPCSPSPEAGAWPVGQAGRALRPLLSLMSPGRHIHCDTRILWCPCPRARLWQYPCRVSLQWVINTPTPLTLMHCQLSMAGTRCLPSKATCSQGLTPQTTGPGLHSSRRLPMEDPGPSRFPATKCLD